MKGFELPLAAAIISVTMLVFASIGLRRKANEEYVDQLEKRISQLEIRAQRCEQARDALVRDNQELMRRLILGEGKP